MRCKDFHEIADSYLSDELLVETNHEVFLHLENCEKCREELVVRRELRSKIKAAVFNSAGAAIRPAFAANLRADLRKEIFQETFWTELRHDIFSLRFLTASTAVLLIALFVGLSPFSNIRQQNAASKIASKTEPTAADSVDGIWREISLEAVGDHEHCALDLMAEWQKDPEKNSPEKISFRENILDRAAREFPEQIELIHVHDCIFKNRKFKHAVMRVGGRVVSVLLTETDIAENKNGKGVNRDPAIICQKQTGFQVASFAGKNEAIFVISDLPEAENLSLARSLSNVMQS